MKKTVGLCILVLLFSFVHAQKPNWQNLDFKTDSVFGISTEKAYSELLKNKKAKLVIVAVMDIGTDIAHKDLQSVIWTNYREIPENGIDDDHNGYVDDLHGWNFIGSEIGKEDLVNLMKPKKGFYDSLSYAMVPEAYRTKYHAYRKLSNDYPGHVNGLKAIIQSLENAKQVLDSIVKKMDKQDPTVEDLKNYQPANDQEKQLLSLVIPRLPLYSCFGEYKKREIEGPLELSNYHISHGLSFEDTARDSPLQHTFNNGDISNDITGPIINPNSAAMHGTHIAGIIAAVRDNNIGIKGVADHVQIMTLKVMSSYRELRDKNLAEAIRYAVDNGAKVINLSFGKSYTWDKKDVDDAVKYAMRKDVLIVHAAGNDGLNLDDKSNPCFPSKYYLDGSGEANAWITVGASGWIDDASLIAPFSNYGKKTVDVFAPGVQINSTIPGSEYRTMSGTSMATPVVVGLAALIREYYPNLSAVQVKDIILKSVVKPSHIVNIKDGNETKRVFLRDICVAGGVVNAYEALKLAKVYK